ncbi:MAG: 3-phosphoshikimate 1-carboxyvinyltransferase, partial [Firmicutes bacterium]|nr:3-phosphoshikimate 1-carboxyvinyltransferase [Bacillota bacterium]
MKIDPWRHGLVAEMTPPGDKSITHRAILFAALAPGQTYISHWLEAADTQASLRLVQALGVRVKKQNGHELVLESEGLAHLHSPEDIVDCANAGTTMRLALGLASGVKGLTVLSGDASLRSRPMARVINPLKQMGVDVLSRANGLAPIALQGGRHTGGCFVLPVASAQVKSALLLAGLSAENPVTVKEPVATRDHTERMLQAMGASLRQDGDGSWTIHPSILHPLETSVPGDPSSAAYWAALAA